MENLSGAPLGTTSVITSPLVVQPAGYQTYQTVQSIVQPEPESHWKWWYWVLFIIFIIIIIGLVIWLIVALTRRNTNRGLGQPCDSNNTCTGGLICSSGLCKVAIGGPCTSVVDCAAGATGCINNVCVSSGSGALNSACSTAMPCGSGLNCISGFCKANIGQNCNRKSDCVPQATACTNGVCVTGGSGGLNQRCPCQAGLICDGSTDFCKKHNGAPCTSSSECLTGSTCNRGVCRVIRPSIPDGMEGALCNRNSDCNRGLTCSSGVCRSPSRPSRRVEDCEDEEVRVSAQDRRRREEAIIFEEDQGRHRSNRLKGVDGTSDHLGPSSNLQGSTQIINSDGEEIYFFDKLKIIDLIRINDENTYLITSDGDILYDNGKEMVKIDSTLAINQLISFGGWIYALTGLEGQEGQLYRLANDNIEDTNWKWSEINWLTDINQINHASTTEDGQYLWLQSKKRGYLYQFIDYEHDPKLIEKVKLSRDTIRNYGKNKDNYIEINLKENTANLQPMMKGMDTEETIEDVIDAVILNGDIIEVINFNSEYQKVKRVGDKAYYFKINS